MGADAERPVSSFYERAYTIEEHETKDFYSAWAATYDEELVEGRAYAMPARCRAAFDAHVVDRRTPVIDLGCGTGLLGRELAELGFETIDGIDYSPEMIERAHATGIYRDLWSADLNEPLDIVDGAYGAAAAMGVFSFGHVYADALDEICRIITPGGTLIIGVNEVFVNENTLVPKLEQLDADGIISLDLREHGAHMPVSGVDGWVFVATRRH